MKKKPLRPKKAAKPKRGRPTRRDASSKALEGVDLMAVDPKQILREIAADRSAPATARLQAARALLNSEGTARKQPEDQERDPVARRALRILNGGKST